MTADQSPARNGVRAFTVFVGAVCVGIGALAVVRGEPQAAQTAPAFPVSIRVDAGAGPGVLAGC